jgi:threonine dehydrogenase-like Zn-dependent dehydrogenase
VVLAGNAVADVAVDMRHIVNGELVVRGANATRFQVGRALGWLAAKRIDPTPMITGIFPLQDAPRVLALAHTDKNQGKLMIEVTMT